VKVAPIATNSRLGSHNKTGHPAKAGVQSSNRVKVTPIATNSRLGSHNETGHPCEGRGPSQQQTCHLRINASERRYNSKSSIGPDPT